MIIVRLEGGLGNQMFQYAMGRHLAELQSTTLKLDVSTFEAYKLHRYSLHCFHIWEHFATQTEIDSHRGDISTNSYKLVTRGLLRRLHINYPTGFVSPDRFVLFEKTFNFDPTYLQRTGPIYVWGYWQTEKYFAAIRDALLREFAIKYRQDLESKRISELIDSTHSVSLHVRRGDYVQDPRTNQVHGACDQSYYQRSVQHIAAHIENPHFFVFSDDPIWVKKELKLGFPTTVVDHNDASRNFEDLRLMSQCKHNIIANSSFSWWGAWLNENPSKIVMAPKQWFADQAREAQAGDIVPEAWTKV